MLRLFRYRLPLKTGAIREGLILQSENRYAEIAPLPGFSKETLEEAEQEVLEWIHDGKKPELPSVKWGIECLEYPLASVRIPLCALGPRKGFSIVKLKLGHLTPDDAVKLVKKHASHTRLRLDCNQAWTLDEALRFAKYFTPSDFAYLEEPVQTFEELIEFSKQTRFPIALDESIQSDWSQIPSLKAIVVKPTIVGTIPKIPSHLDLVLSSSYESGLGLLHIANRASPLVAAGLDTYQTLQEDLLTHPIDCSANVFSWNESHPYIQESRLCAL